MATVHNLFTQPAYIDAQKKGYAATRGALWDFARGGWPISMCLDHGFRHVCKDELKRG